MVSHRRDFGKPVKKSKKIVKMKKNEKKQHAYQQTSFRAHKSMEIV